MRGPMDDAKFTTWLIVSLVILIVLVGIWGFS